MNWIFLVYVFVYLLLYYIYLSFNECDDISFTEISANFLAVSMYLLAVF